MKALVVLTQPPLLEGGAPGRCAVGLLRGLRLHGVDVTAIAARQHFAVDGEPPGDLPVRVVPVDPEPPGWHARANRVRRPRGELGRGRFGALVREEAAGADVLHLEETETAWCDEGVSVPSLVHVHYLIRRDRPWLPPWRREGRFLLETVLAERAAIRRHGHLVASSPLIADELRRRAPSADVVVAPLTLEPSHYPPAPLDGPPVAGLIGTARWPATARAAERLAARVWPQVRRSVADARLVVAGRGMDRLGLPSAPGVEVVGHVGSSAEFLAGLSLLLFPLERGSGMKVKVLEAIASGVPVVTTPAGAEGIDAGDGVVVAASDDELAAAAARILADPGERRQRGDAAREAFLRRYAPGPATLPLVELYRRMAAWSPPS
ncbi:MAG TPA: glycosyltransferase family 4 protein [Gaiellaceae bacterium]|nr:glycosyltransferase family 4 protein [Gaiellaceae bacterium]